MNKVEKIDLKAFLQELVGDIDNYIKEAKQEMSKAKECLKNGVSEEVIIGPDGKQWSVTHTVNADIDNGKFESSYVAMRLEEEVVAESDDARKERIEEQIRRELLTSNDPDFKLISELCRQLTD